MILEAMYNGEFYPCETVVPTSPEYRKAIHFKYGFSAGLIVQQEAHEHLLNKK